MSVETTCRRYWTGSDIAPSKFQHLELHCLQWSGIGLDQLLPEENMQTYEKCADYIQTHFMLLREDITVTCKMLNKPRSAVLLHCREVSYMTVGLHRASPCRHQALHARAPLSKGVLLDTSE